MLVKYISFLLFVVQYSNGADILAVVPCPSYSHQIAFTHIWKELSLRGHRVTLVTTNPIKDATLTNLTEIDTSWSYKVVTDISNVAENIVSMWNFYDMILNMLLEVSYMQLSHSSIQDLINSGRRFDVVFVEFLFPEFLGLAEIYGCPKILISSMGAMDYFHNKIGNPSHPILYPDPATPFHGSLNFKERVTSTVYSLYLSYHFNYKIMSERQKILRTYFNITKTIEELVSDIDMMFVTVNAVIQDVRAIGPTTINIGGQRPSISPVPLPRDLAEFLDSAKDGFIYFSLGSNVKSKDLNEDSLNAIIESLREVPYKVLWKFEADDLSEKPDNVKLVKWAPQQNVLAHPNIKLFVTQGGLQSMEEAIYSEVPFVVIPFFGDQEQNAKLMESKGIAKIVGRRPALSKVELKDAILEVINNPRYKSSVKRLKQLALDTPMTGLETAIWWTEYVIRNKGAKHLRNPAADIPFYQYYLIDVISFLLLVAILVSLSIFLFLRILLRFFLYIYKVKMNNRSDSKKLQ